MKFEYCAIYYNWGNDFGEVSVAPQGFNERSLANALNRLGSDGWELVSSNPVTTGAGSRLYLIFKKPISKK